MRISDWSSDVCSSDLLAVCCKSASACCSNSSSSWTIAESKLSTRCISTSQMISNLSRSLLRRRRKLGRASCRGRVCQYVSLSVVAVAFKKKNNKRQQYKLTHKTTTNKCENITR